MITQYITSILFMALTYAVLFAASKLFLHSKSFPLLHPLITASCCLIAILYYFDITTPTYLANTELLVHLLAPATVALGVPLYNNFTMLLRYKKQLILPLLIGALLSPVTAIFCLIAFNVEPVLINSMVSKAITSPIAIDITKLLNGTPAIAVLFVLLSGIIGAATATSLFNLLKIKHDISKGVAIGVSAHAIGTTRALQISPECAAFSVIAMCLNGVTTATLVVIYASFI